LLHKKLTTISVQQEEEISQNPGSERQSRQGMQSVDLLLLPAAERKAAFYSRFKGIAHRIPNKHIASPPTFRHKPQLFQQAVSAPLVEDCVCHIFCLLQTKNPPK